MEQHDRMHHDTPQKGPLTRVAAWWLPASGVGLALGAVAGWLIRDGTLSAGPLPLLAASSGAAAMIVCGGVLAALFGLGASLVAVSRTKPGTHESEAHGRRGGVALLPIIGTAAIVLFTAYTHFSIAARAIGTGEVSDQSNRVTWNQKNTARVGGAEDRQTLAAALAVAYPLGSVSRNARTVLEVPDQWQVALAATPLIARPMNAAVVPRSEGVTLAAPREAISGDGPTIAAEVDRRIAAQQGVASRNVIVVSAEHPALALPAAAYAARTGTPILFATRDGVPPPTAGALRTRGGRANIFVLGGVTESASAALRQFGRVRFVGDSDMHRKRRRVRKLS